MALVDNQLSLIWGSVMQNKSESKNLSIKASAHEYQVEIGVGLFENYCKSFDGFVIADQRFSNLVTAIGLSKVIYVEAIEENKTLATVEQVMISLKKMGMTRDDEIIAIGGGIIQDIATLSASLYMRGVPWTYFPTTLLGMTDSCIGGKSSINAGDVKNLVGNIYPPNEILIDVSFLETLQQVDLNAGLAEAAKIAFCKGSDAFTFFLEAAENKSATGHAELLYFVLSQKKWFIEIDEFDRAERKFLNFGHTFGHALESATNHHVPHGIAVALGVSAAVAFVADERELSQIECDLDSYMKMIAQGGIDVNEILKIINWTKFADAFDGDKKHSTDFYKLITPLTGGQVEIKSLGKNAETIERVKRAQTRALEGATK
jgi:3-dehydroquinate synthase